MTVGGGRSPTVREGGQPRPPSRSGFCHLISLNRRLVQLG